MVRTDDDSGALVLWLTLALSSAAHVLLYLMPRTQPAPAARRMVASARTVVFMDAVESGKASGEPAGHASGAASSPRPPETARPAATSPAMRRARPPVRTRVREPTEAAVGEVEPSEPDAAPNEDAPPPEPEMAATTDAALLPPSELANQLFIEELMRRAPVAGLRGSGGADGADIGGRGCADPVLGTWRARRYDFGLGRHVVFTLRLTERRGSRVEGTIVNRSWSGGRSQRRPPRCTPGVSDHTVTMPARGRLVGNSFRLDALSHRRSHHCFDEGSWVYNLDHFTGTLEGDTFRAVNNDGGHELNSPYTFERILCQ